MPELNCPTVSESHYNVKMFQRQNEKNLTHLTIQYIFSGMEVDPIRRTIGIIYIGALPFFHGVTATAQDNVTCYCSPDIWLLVVS